MRLVVYVLTMLLGPASLAPAVRTQNIVAIYRDGDARTARTPPSPGHLSGGRIPGGDVDNRCDGICHIVLCDCGGTFGTWLCTRVTGSNCGPFIITVVAGDHYIVPNPNGDLLLECAPGRSACLKLRHRSN